jgi:hypothetical protein
LGSNGGIGLGARAWWVTLGQAVAGLNPYLKGVSLGLFQPTSKEVKGLAEKAYPLYEKFGPEIPSGKKWWGASGKLDPDFIRKMASA